MPAVYDNTGAYNYFRRAGHQHLLFGGAAPRGEIRRGDFATLQHELALMFPSLVNARITHQWTGLVGISRDFLPHLARLPQGMWVAAGYSGHGVALATEMGWILSKAVLHGEHDDQVRALTDLAFKPYPLGVALWSRVLVPLALDTMKYRNRLSARQH